MKLNFFLIVVKWSIYEYKKYIFNYHYSVCQSNFLSNRLYIAKYIRVYSNLWKQWHCNDIYHHIIYTVFNLNPWYWFFFLPTCFLHYCTMLFLLLTFLSHMLNKHHYMFLYYTSCYYCMYQWFIELFLLPLEG